MPRYIDADAFRHRILCQRHNMSVNEVLELISTMPTADVVERKKGKWTEKEVIHAEEAKEIISEWQSCRCSVCGRYLTQPYMYYFDNPNYCSFCGAEMRGGDDA